MDTRLPLLKSFPFRFGFVRRATVFTTWNIFLNSSHSIVPFPFLSASKISCKGISSSTLTWRFLNNCPNSSASKDPFPSTSILSNSFFNMYSRTGPRFLPRFVPKSLRILCHRIPSFTIFANSGHSMVPFPSSSASAIKFAILYGFTVIPRFSKTTANSATSKDPFPSESMASNSPLRTVSSKPPALPNSPPIRDNKPCHSTSKCRSSLCGMADSSIALACTSSASSSYE
mmetsp:Transcript_26466/g.70237  ORF Transcript_26466/g.70237 Transcript_26466/m.70237 type:complete len:230 (-) Transcript_26466:185-874(-)